MGKTQGIRAGKAYVELGVSNKLTAGLKRAQRQLKEFGAGVRAIGQQMAGMSAAFLVPAIASVKTFSNMGDAAAKMAKRTGFSVEAISELGFAAEQSGADLASLETGLKRMARVINDAATGSKEAVDALAGIGVSLQTLQGLNPEQQFKTIAQGLSQVTDESTRAALAQELLGRAGTMLLPMMENGAQGIEALQKQARALGLTISTETARDAELLTDTLNMLARTAKAVAFAVGAALSESVVHSAESISLLAVNTAKWIRENRELVVTVAKIALAVGAAGTAFIAFGLTMSLAGSAITGMMAIAATVKAGFLLLISPIGLVTAAVVGVGLALAAFTDIGGKAIAWLKARFKSLTDFAHDVFGGISDALAAGDIAAAVNVLWSAIKLAWQKGTDAIQRLWENLWADVRIAAINVWFKLRDEFALFTDYMEARFPNFTAFITKAWATMTYVMRSTWAKFRSWLTDQFISMGEGLVSLLAFTGPAGAGMVGPMQRAIRALRKQLLDDEDDIAAARMQNAKDLADEMAAIDKQYTDALGEAERKRNRTPEELATEQAMERAKREAEYSDAVAKADAARAAALAASSKELSDAEREFQAARKAAQDARNKGLQGMRNPPPFGTELDKPAKDAAEQIEKRVSVTGTFNPAAIRALAGGSETLVKIGVQQVDLLKAISRNQRVYRPTFG